MILSGEGWLHFGRSTNLLDYKYCISTVEPAEMLYDKAYRRLDLGDCRYIIRRKFLALDEALAMFEGSPKHQDIVRNTWSAWGHWDNLGGNAAILYRDYADELYEQDGTTQRIAVYDAYYRETETRDLVVDELGGVTLYNPDLHYGSVTDGSLIKISAPVPVMKNTWFIGAEEIVTGDSPHPHNEYPFIPLVCYRDHESRSTYGLVRGMIGPQDAYNNANVRIQHLLNSRQIITEAGAFDSPDGDGPTEDDIISEANRQDGFFKVNRGYRFEINTNYSEINKLQEIKIESRNELRDASGINNSFGGRNVEQQSGIAIASLAELSATTLAEVNANYQVSRQRLGHLVLAHLIQDIGTSPKQVAIRKSAGTLAKIISLNENTGDGINNALVKARMQITLSDVTTTAGYRAQNQEQMMRIYQVSPPDVQAKLINYIIAESPMPKRHEFLEDLMKNSGGTEEERAAIQQQQAEAQQAALELEQKEKLADIAYTEARAEKALAEASAVGQPPPEATPQRSDDDSSKQDLLKQIRRAAAARALH